MTNKSRLSLFSAAYLIAGAILFGADAISRGGSYCGVLGAIFLTIGVLLSLWEPLKKGLSFVFREKDPS
ncbi:MAG: hypothetical protein IIU88_03780 [Clostridia bacterium]|nr:hypothetical protein [Clostridia bacterium]